jgi:hypothetical protein
MPVCRKVLPHAQTGVVDTASSFAKGPGDDSSLAVSDARDVSMSPVRAACCVVAR